MQWLFEYITAGSLSADFSAVKFILQKNYGHLYFEFWVYDILLKPHESCAGQVEIMIFCQNANKPIKNVTGVSWILLTDYSFISF